MKDMDKAVSRIMKAIERNERIMVYGDYDVDGTTSVAMVSSFLKGLQARAPLHPDAIRRGIRRVAQRCGARQSLRMHPHHHVGLWDQRF